MLKRGKNTQVRSKIDLCVNHPLVYTIYRTVWEQQIERTLNANRSNDVTKYVLLRSNQLVGAALIIFVKASIVETIRNVETSIKKVQNSCYKR
jgi:hypothetical protein